MKLHSVPLPAANPTHSYWFGTSNDALENHGSDTALPRQTGTVIIGSGISGAVLATEILQRDPQCSIVMLDARNVCGGATGRNGGHIKPDRYKSFAKHQLRYGADMAKTLANFEHENMVDFVRFIRENGYAQDADLVETIGVDFYMNEAAWKTADQALQTMEAAGGNTSGIRRHNKKEVESRFRLGPAAGAISYPAYSVWPRKVVLQMLRKAVSQGLQLYTHTPVVRVVKEANGPGWVVKTTRGDVLCSKVFHATNGHAASLLPELTGKVVPVKANAAAIEPSPAYYSQPLEHTCGIQWGEDFDYMIQRPTDGMPLIIGGCDLAHPNSLPGVVGDADDSSTTPEIQAALKAFPKQYLSGWAKDVTVRKSWSGIMGFTADEMPFVGEVPGRPGQFVVAGYSGHGMARSFLANKALVQLAYAEPIDERVPMQYLDIQNRLQARDEEWDRFVQEAYSCKPQATVKPRL